MWDATFKHKKNQNKMESKAIGVNLKNSKCYLCPFFSFSIGFSLMSPNSHLEFFIFHHKANGLVNESRPDA